MPRSSQPDPRRSHPLDSLMRTYEPNPASMSGVATKQKGEISCETPPLAIRILEDPVSAPNHNRAVPQSPGRREQARYLPGLSVLTCCKSFRRHRLSSVA
jgi:hypothetical protein